MCAIRRETGHKGGQGLIGRKEITWKPREGERGRRGKGTLKVRFKARRPKIGKENVGLAGGPQMKSSLLSLACLLPLKGALLVDMLECVGA